MKNIDPYEFFKDIYHDNSIRIRNKRDLEKDIEQFRINLKMRDAELNTIEELNKIEQNYPIVFIVGVPRSGTTLLSQILAANFDVSFFPKKIAKYYMAPISGLKKNGIKELDRSKINFHSDLGNVNNEFMPHEMGYFWHYWIRHDGNDELNDKQVQKRDFKGLGEQLNAYAKYFNQPFMIKNLSFSNFIIETLARQFKNAHFILIKRNINDNINSILRARKKIYANEKYWWSVRPKDFNEWSHKSPHEQVTWQYKYINAFIENSFLNMDKERFRIISYEDLIDSPLQTVENLFSFFQRLNVEFRFEFKN